MVTTPNVEYNVKFETLPAGKMRHKDHRFEWTRPEFQSWANTIAERFGYSVRFLPIGPEDSIVGSPTQMGILLANETDDSRIAVVALVGASGSGKSSFARKHFRPTEVLSSDFCRGLVSDDENSQAATNDAFEVLHFIASKRLTAGKLVVVDATNVQPEARKSIIALARQYHCLPVAIVFDLPRSFATNRIVTVQNALSVLMLCGNNLSSYADLCVTLSVKVFAESMYCIHLKRLTRQRLSFSRCGTI